MNKLMLCALAGALALSGAASAHAEKMTSKVRAWNPAAKQLVLDDRQVLLVDPAKTAVPETLSPGDTVTIDFTSDDNGYIAIVAVVIDQEQ